MKMKKALGILFVVLIVLGLAGCDMNFFNKDTIYFYSLVGEEETPSRIKYRSDGHTIIMSRLGGQNESDASAIFGTTFFSLTVNGDSLSFDDKEVAELANGWSVVQSFDFGIKERGEYVLVGKTTGGVDRTDTVTLVIE